MARKGQWKALFSLRSEHLADRKGVREETETQRYGCRKGVLVHGWYSCNLALLFGKSS